jgi:TetR/AcrR family transcriptional repressor of nem operon
VARTKAFDPDAALDRALDVFWTKGYAHTSTQDLVDALAINRSSLYGTFGSKHALYARALERYGVVGRERVERAIDGPGPVRERVRRALMSVVEDDLRDHGPRGCFAASAALELAADDPEVRRLVAASFAEARDVLRDELERARDAGELDADADIDRLAASLLATLQGLRVLAKGTGDRRLVEQAADAGTALL